MVLEEEESTRRDTGAYLAEKCTHQLFEAHSSLNFSLVWTSQSPNPVNSYFRDLMRSDSRQHNEEELTKEDFLVERSSKVQTTSSSDDQEDTLLDSFSQYKQEDVCPTSRNSQDMRNATMEISKQMIALKVLAPKPPTVESSNGFSAVAPGGHKKDDMCVTSCNPANFQDTHCTKSGKSTKTFVSKVLASKPPAVDSINGFSTVAPDSQCSGKAPCGVHVWDFLQTLSHNESNNSNMQPNDIESLNDISDSNSVDRETSDQSKWGDEGRNKKNLPKDHSIDHVDFFSNVLPPPQHQISLSTSPAADPESSVVRRQLAVISLVYVCRRGWGGYVIEEDCRSFGTSKLGNLSGSDQSFVNLRDCQKKQPIDQYILPPPAYSPLPDPTLRVASLLPYHPSFNLSHSRQLIVSFNDIVTHTSDPPNLCIPAPTKLQDCETPNPSRNGFGDHGTSNDSADGNSNNPDEQDESKNQRQSRVNEKERGNGRDDQEDFPNPDQAGTVIALGKSVQPVQEKSYEKIASKLDHTVRPKFPVHNRQVHSDKEPPEKHTLNEMVVGNIRYRSNQMFSSQGSTVTGNHIPSMSVNLCLPCEASHQAAADQQVVGTATPLAGDPYTIGFNACVEPHFADTVFKVVPNYQNTSSLPDMQPLPIECSLLRPYTKTFFSQYGPP